jgi:hypothetical protein
MAKVTGQVILRKTLKVMPDGRRAVMIIGVITLPDDHVSDEDEQYLVEGFTIDKNIFQVTVSDPQNVYEKTRGMTANQVLSCHIWRI